MRHGKYSWRNVTFKLCRENTCKTVAYVGLGDRDCLGEQDFSDGRESACMIRRTVRNDGGSDLKVRQIWHGEYWGII